MQLLAERCNVLQVGSEHFYSKDSFRWQFFLHLNCKIDSLCNCCKALLLATIKKSSLKNWKHYSIFFILYFFPKIFFYNKCFNLSYPTGFIKTRCIWDKLPIKKKSCENHTLKPHITSSQKFLESTHIDSIISFTYILNVHLVFWLFTTVNICESFIIEHMYIYSLI